MRAVITVVGKDKPGILAYIATKVHVMHEDIFNSMHTI